MSKYMVDINYVKDNGYDVIELISTKFLTKKQAYSFLDSIDDIWVDEKNLQIVLLTYSNDGEILEQVEYMYGKDSFNKN